VSADGDKHYECNICLFLNNRINTARREIDSYESNIALLKYQISMLTKILRGHEK
jgi:hypothetical protein